MEYPSTTCDDIEQNEAVDILVRAGTTNEVNSEQIDWKVTLTDRNGKQFMLTVFDGEGDSYELIEDNWYVLRNASGNIYNGNPELRSNFGKMSVEEVPTPSPDVAPILQSETERRESLSGGIVALDIEALTTESEDELDLGDSRHVEVFCVALGYQPEPNMPAETTVLFREDGQPRAEIELIEDTCKWIQQRDPSVLLTYKGSDFDIEHLCKRPELIGNSSSPFRDVLETVDYRDLDRGGKLIHVTDVEPTYWDIYDHSLDPREWRREQGKSGLEVSEPKVDGGDVPYFAEKYLELLEEDMDGTPEFRALHELLRRYAVSDVRPLFDLYENEI